MDHHKLHLRDATLNTFLRLCTYLARERAHNTMKSDNFEVPRWLIGDLMFTNISSPNRFDTFEFLVEKAKEFCQEEFQKYDDPELCTTNAERALFLSRTVDIRRSPCVMCNVSGNAKGVENTTGNFRDNRVYVFWPCGHTMCENPCFQSWTLEIFLTSTGSRMTDKICPACNATVWSEFSLMDIRFEISMPLFDRKIRDIILEAIIIDQRNMMNTRPAGRRRVKPPKKRPRLEKPPTVLPVEIEFPEKLFKMLDFYLRKPEEENRMMSMINLDWLDE